LGSVERALALATEAAELMPANPWCQVRIASVLRQGGDMDGAIAAAQRAVELGSGAAYFAAFLQELRDSAMRA
jgi:hypothetical protein